MSVLRSLLAFFFGLQPSEKDESASFYDKQVRLLKKCEEFSVFFSVVVLNPILCYYI